MELVYSVCYYYEGNKEINLKRHLESFKLLEKSNIFEKCTYAIVCMTDSIHKSEKIKNKVKDIIGDANILILVEYNWGGTIAGLWKTYTHFKDSKDNIYVSHFEEDFVPKNEEATKKAIELLQTGKYVYIGECKYNKINSRDDQGRLSKKRFKKATRLGDPEVWTDGGYYFTSIDRLKQMEGKIGIFHKGDPKDKYNHDKDGIDIGEVGFPTLLHHAGFEFGFLNRKDFFVNYGN